MSCQRLLLRVGLILIVATLLVGSGCGGRKKAAGSFGLLLKQGQEHMREGRYREAVASFEKAASLDQDSPEPYMRLALVYEECLHDPATALRYYRKYQQLEKDAVKREEVQGWIQELERLYPNEVEDPDAPELPPEPDPLKVAQGSASEESRTGSAKTTAPSATIPVEETAQYKELLGKLNAALSENRLLKSQNTSGSALSTRLAKAEESILQLEQENKALTTSLREAESRVTAAERKTGQTAQLRNELEEAKRQRDAAHADLDKAAVEINRLNKSLTTYATTLAAVQKTNDELKRAAASAPTKQPPPSNTQVRQYTVRRGETLKIIAGYSAVYGDSKKWILIYTANKEKIRDPNNLTPGMVLKIPPG
jgi:nucleoid-associated protein YgaU